VNSITIETLNIIKMNIVATPYIYCGLHIDFQFVRPTEYYDEWLISMTDSEYQWDQLEKSVGTLEITMNDLNIELIELRKKRKLLKLHQDIDRLAWAKVHGVELHIREIEKIIQNCELTKGIISNEMACKDIPISSKEAKEGYNPKFTKKERKFIEENLKNDISKRFGKRGEKRTAKLEGKLERMQLGEREYNESRNKKKNVKGLKKLLFVKGKKDYGIRKEKAANNKVEY
jgi:hypothetical protein